MTDAPVTTDALAAITARLNEAASDYRIGELQERRKEVKGRVRSFTLFPAEPPSPRWVHHLGGREELQFNLGYEQVEGQQWLRHGVAFSLEPSRSLPDPAAALALPMQHFNDHLAAHPALFSAFQMWTQRPGGPRVERAVGPIRPEDATNGTFIFLGKLGPAEPTDEDLRTILKDFDRLLPLYEYVLRESAVSGVPAAEGAQSPVPGTPAPSGKESTVVTRAEQILNIDLRHNRVQKALHTMMVAAHGREAVHHEHRTPHGGSVDLRVQTREGIVTYYEIKTGGSARACLREALGQLMEYALWPGAEPVHQWVVVGDVPATPDAHAYLDTLRIRFGLPLAYLHLPPGEQADATTPTDT